MSKKRILIPLDASKASRTIIPYVKEFFKPEEYKLYFLKVFATDVEEIIIPPSHAALEWTPRMYELVAEWQEAEHESHQHKQDALCKALEDALADEAAIVKADGYEVETRVTCGDPAQRIEETIETLEVDLVAMTTHAREGLKRLIKGSVAGQVLHDMAVPVLLFHPVYAKKD
jgi:nucleotide-binding universal stress UspA family protein